MKRTSARLSPRWPLPVVLLIAASIWPVVGKAQKPTPSPAAFVVMNRQGASIDSLTDGDSVKFKVTLDQAHDLAIVAAFKFADDQRLLGRCIVPRGEQSCETEIQPALGWYWGKAGKPQPEREIRAESGDPGLPENMKFLGTTKLRIAPRPVVLVHGLASSAATWAAYARQGGFLSSIGLRGFAAGDGQVEGGMFTGDPAQPQRPTKTIAENAGELGRYIAGVKRATGAQMVDVVAHSMGGLITRYYIDRLMSDRDVAQLMMLGTPNGGTPCATLPASLGFYLPATLELRTAYLREVFNRQITRRRGAPFYALAGTRIVESFKAPCTATPSDLLVSRLSAADVDAPVSEMPLLHNDMTGSELVFKNFVLPHLQRQAGEFPATPDAPPPATVSAPEQLTKVFSGHIDFGSSREITVNLDNVSVASFAHYDPTRSLKVTVRGATGNVIELTPAAHGLVNIDDPSTLFTLGYGFRNPKPGPWKITLQTTANTPGKGADYAIIAKVIGGAELRAQADRMVVQAEQPVTIGASLLLADQPLPNAVLKASVRRPDGGNGDLNFAESGEGKRATWTPMTEGIYSVEIVAEGASPDGLTIERSDFLSFAVQPGPERIRWTLVALSVAGITVFTLLLFWFMQRRGRRSSG